jgi:hypothetical protein
MENSVDGASAAYGWSYTEGRTMTLFLSSKFWICLHWGIQEERIELN